MTSKCFKTHVMSRLQALIVCSVLQQHLAALLGAAGPHLSDLYIHACDDIFNNYTFDNLWPCTQLETLTLGLVDFEIDLHHFNEGMKHLRRDGCPMRHIRSHEWATAESPTRRMHFCYCKVWVWLGLLRAINHSI
jgi:hypothetical protein